MLNRAQLFCARRGRLFGVGPMGVLRRKRAGKARRESLRESEGEREPPSDSQCGNGEERRMDMEVNKSEDVFG